MVVTDWIRASGSAATSLVACLPRRARGALNWARVPVAGARPTAPASGCRGARAHLPSADRRDPIRSQARPTMTWALTLLPTPRKVENGSGWPKDRQMLTCVSAGDGPALQALVLHRGDRPIAVRPI